MSLLPQSTWVPNRLYPHSWWSYILKGSWQSPSSWSLLLWCLITLFTIWSSHLAVPFLITSRMAILKYTLFPHCLLDLLNAVFMTKLNLLSTAYLTPRLPNLLSYYCPGSSLPSHWVTHHSGSTTCYPSSPRLTYDNLLQLFWVGA